MWCVCAHSVGSMNFDDFSTKSIGRSHFVLCQWIVHSLFFIAHAKKSKTFANVSLVIENKKRNCVQLKIYKTIHNRCAKKRIIDGFIDLPDKKCRRYERVWVSCWNALLANFSKQMCPLCISQSGWMRFFFVKEYFFSFVLHPLTLKFFFLHICLCFESIFFIKHFFSRVFFLYSIVRSVCVCVRVRRTSFVGEFLLSCMWFDLSKTHK